MSESEISSGEVISAAEKIAVTGVGVGVLNVPVSIKWPLEGAVVYALTIGLVFGAAGTAVLAAGWHR